MPGGLFVTFEGGEGVGKTTQIKRLADALETLGHHVITTREPGGTPGAEAVRDLFVSGETNRWDVMTELLLATAARRDHVTRLINPALESGSIVLCDRFVHSTLAYQGGRGDVTDEHVRSLHTLAIGDVWPDITFIFDLDPAISAERSKARDGDNPGRFEQMNGDFHSRLRARFLAIASEDDVCNVIDAAARQDAVEQDILSALQPHLERIRHGR